jgi:two-component system nitrogen regulation response regulator NtrX
MKQTILIVDDERSILRTLSASLRDEGYLTITAKSGEEAIECILKELPDLVLLDIWMEPGMDGIETLKKINHDFPGMQVIIMSGHGNIETAVRAIKLGAFNFIEKPLSIDKLLITIEQALQYNKLEEENALLKSKVLKTYDITGVCDEIKKLKQQIKLVAPTNGWVLITGENGTGKEFVARTIHLNSKRKDKPFVDINCAAIPEELIESELFGYEKGAFTGATTKKKGKFDLANEGTILLDEIADMSLKTQAKILRILQEQKFERVGGSQSIEVDVRIIAATNKKLEDEIKNGKFREDLYYRLNVIPIDVPPLRERREDIPLLVENFLQEFTKEDKKIKKEIQKEAMDCLTMYNWPGNVRELRNIIERLVIMTPKRIISKDDLPLPIKSSVKDVNDDDAFKAGNFKEAKSLFEKEFLLRKLTENNYNVSKTAEAIGIERTNIYRKLKTYDINISEKN